MPTTATKSDARKVPKLRFRGFEGEWEEKKLGDVAEITSSKRVYSSDYVTTGVPFFRGKEISELKRSQTASDILFIKESKFLEFKNKFGAPQKNDLLITSVGTLGNIYRVNLDYDFYFKDGNLIWLKNPQVNSSFLEMTLDFHTKELLKGVIGSTQKALTIEGIKKVEILFPSRLEQQKIADFLTSTDQWLDTLRGQKGNLESYKKGMMQKIFNQEIRFKDDEGKEFPEWEKKKLGEIFEIEAGKTKSEQITETGENIIVDMGGISSTGELIANKHTNSAQNFLKKDDLVMPKDDIGGGFIIGKVAIVPTNDKYISGDHIYILSRKMGEAKYFFYAINSHYVSKALRKKANGTAQLGLGKNSVFNQRISYPSLQEQQKIADFLTSIDKLIESKQKQITLAEQWKKGLMQNLFV